MFSTIRFTPLQCQIASNICLSSRVKVISVIFIIFYGIIFYFRFGVLKIAVSLLASFPPQFSPYPFYVKVVVVNDYTYIIPRLYSLYLFIVTLKYENKSQLTIFKNSQKKTNTEDSPKPQDLPLPLPIYPIYIYIYIYLNNISKRINIAPKCQ